jgi:hypothetical protein
LVSDRRETLDVASRYPEVVEKMKRELGAWQRSVVDSYEGADGIAP